MAGEALSEPPRGKPGTVFLDPLFDPLGMGPGFNNPMDVMMQPDLGLGAVGPDMMFNQGKM